MLFQRSGFLKSKANHNEKDRMASKELLFQRSGFLKSKANHNEDKIATKTVVVISKIGFFKIESKSQPARCTLCNTVSYFKDRVF